MRYPEEQPDVVGQARESAARPVAARRPPTPGGKALLRLLQLVDSRGLIEVGDAAVRAATASNGRSGQPAAAARRGPVGSAGGEGSESAVLRAAPPAMLDRGRDRTAPKASRFRRRGPVGASHESSSVAVDAPEVASLYTGAADSRVGPPVAGAPQWRSVGPATISNGQTYGSSRINVSGRVSAIAVDPSNAAHILAGAANGGVWETRDRGATWGPRTDYASTTTVGALAFDPTNPARALCGTGEGDWWSYLGQGILQSTNGGASWATLSTAPFVGQGFHSLVVDPGNGSHVLAGTTAALYVSSDGGATWTNRRSQRTWSISIAPAGGATAEILAGCADGVYRSVNGGTSWTRVALPGGPATFGRVAVSIARSNPAVAYVWGESGGTGYLWRRSGRRWRAVPLPPDASIGQSWYDWHLAAAPDRDTQVYVGAIDVHRGDLTGSTWAWTNLSSKSAGDSIHPDQHSIAFDPVNANIVYAGSDGGLFMSPDRGITWQSLNNGLVISEFEYIAQDVGSARWLIGGTQDNGTDRWTGPAAWEHVEDADGGDVGVNRTNPSTVFHSRQWWALLRSTTRGNFGSWSFISPPQAPGEASLFYAPFEASANGGDTIAYGGDNLHVSRDNGTTWSRLTLGTRATAIAVPNPTTVFVGSWDGRIFRSTWNGASWPALTALATPRTNAYVSDIHVNAANLNRIWVTYSTIGGGRVYRSDDGGATWTDRSAGLPALPMNAVEVDPANANRVWVAADVGVHQSLDAGATWTDFANGLPNAFVGDLLFHPHARVLRAGTRNRGIWEIPVDGWMTQPVCGVQWTGTVAPNEERRWFTHSWPATWHMVWTIMPTSPVPGAPQLSWAVRVERASAEFTTYWISVKNLTASAVTFEGRYCILSRY